MVVFSVFWGAVSSTLVSLCQKNSPAVSSREMAVPLGDHSPKDHGSDCAGADRFYSLANLGMPQLEQIASQL